MSWAHLSLDSIRLRFEVRPRLRSRSLLGHPPERGDLLLQPPTPRGTLTRRDTLARLLRLRRARTRGAFVRRELLDRWRPYKVRPAPGYETGTAQHELLAGFVAAIGYLESIGWDAIAAHERELGERLLAGLPEDVMLHGPPTMEGRVPTFALNVDGRSPTEVAAYLGERGIFVWDGNYYALEVMKRLGLDDGAVRVGIVHYNTVDEVDRLLDEFTKLGGERA